MTTDDSRIVDELTNLGDQLVHVSERTPLKAPGATSRRMRLTRPLLVAAGLIVVVAVAVALQGRSATDSVDVASGSSGTSLPNEPVPTTVDTSTPPGSAPALVMSTEQLSGPSALITGRMSMDSQLCAQLHLGDGRVVAMLWPRGTVVEVHSLGTFILTPDGTAVGPVGETVSVGGGLTSLAAAKTAGIVESDGPCLTEEIAIVNRIQS